MADEITITTGMRVVNGNLEYVGKTRSTTFDQTTARASNFTMDVGTVEETISFGDVVPGEIRLTNLDGTNFVDVGFSTGVYGMTLVADYGTAAFRRKGTQTIYVKADTAGCKIQVEAINT